MREAIEASGSESSVNLTEDAPVRPVECDLRGLEIEHVSFQIGTTQHSAAIFFFRPAP